MLFKLAKASATLLQRKENAVNTKPTSLYATITKNNLTLFKFNTAATVFKEKKQALALKELFQL